MHLKPKNVHCSCTGTALTPINNIGTYLTGYSQVSVCALKFKVILIWFLMCTHEDKSL